MMMRRHWRQLTQVVTLSLGLCLALPLKAAPVAWQCELIENLPPVGHPLREHPLLRGASQSLLRAKSPAQFQTAYSQFERALTPAWKASREAFEIAPPESKQLYKPDKARAFLEKWVLKANAPLRPGRDAFEPAVGVSAMMAYAACRGQQVDTAIRVTRDATGEEAASLRAFAAWLLFQQGKVEQARELAPELNDETFIGAYVLALLTEEPATRGVLLAKAQRVAYSESQRAAMSVLRGE